MKDGGEEKNILYMGKEYSMLGTHAWIDAHTLTVHIMKVKDGVRVEIYPNAHDGISRPLASCKANWQEPPKENKIKVVKRYVR